MIGAEREILVGAKLPAVWQFVEDMGHWAAQMPGYVSHTQASRDDSVWMLDVNMGPFSRQVEIEVRVERWSPPHGVDFTLKGRFEPFQGAGSFRAREAGHGTAVTLRLETEVTGSMSKVLTAMATPVLAKVADEFSANLLQALGGAPVPVEPSVSVSAPTAPATATRISFRARVRRWCALLLQRRASST